MRIAIPMLLLALTACGASTVETVDDGTTMAAPATDSAAFLLEVGATLSDVLVRPIDGIDVLEVTRRAARGVERLRAQRDLARAHLFAAEVTDGRVQRGHWREMNELTTTSTRVRDPQLAADLDFLALWASWRSGHANADARAQRFIDRHATSPDLVLIAWILRGEIAFAQQHWDDALAGFRAVLGRLGHPLYAFALFRSARVWHEQGREDESRQALVEVRNLGCVSEPSPPTLHVALAATQTLGETTVTDASGHERPSTCPVERTTAATGVEDERPPPVE